MLRVCVSGVQCQQREACNAAPRQVQKKVNLESSNKIVKLLFASLLLH